MPSQVSLTLGQFKISHRILEREAPIKHGPSRAYRKILLLLGLAVLILFSFALVPAIETANGQTRTVPVQIQTYGNAWEGEIAFGLWNFTRLSDGYSFGGNVFNSFLVVMKTDGTVEQLRESRDTSYWAVKNIARDTLMFQGEPYETVHFWNITSNTFTNFNVSGHHDVEYNPIKNTFLTLNRYVRTVGNNNLLYDRIVEEAANGTVLWSWDTYDHIPLSQLDEFNDTCDYFGQTVIDFTHANTLQWDYNNSIVYLNTRHTNTFYKINMTTGNIIWSLGEFGNFTLLNEKGNPVNSLWYHSHAPKLVEPNVFIMFDNDYHNATNPNNSHSRIMEVTINEQNMTAWVSWSWEAPTQYWAPYWGKSDRLPNGNRIGVFGTQTHQFAENQPWVGNNTGAVLIEVNPQGQVVRTYTFPPGWGIYRIEEITNRSSASVIPEIDGTILILILLGVTPLVFLRKKLLKRTQ
jgi:Arylsulfotransferase (ASST)